MQSMKTILQLMACLIFVSVGFCSNQSGNEIFLHIVNNGSTNYVGNDIVCPTFNIYTDDYYCDGTLLHHQTPYTGIAPNINPGATYTLGASGLTIYYGCSGAYTRFLVRQGTTTVGYWDLYYNASGTAEATSINVDVNGNTCAAVTNEPPCYTNLMATIVNRDAVYNSYGWVYTPSATNSRVDVGNVIELRPAQQGVTSVNVACSNALYYKVYKFSCHDPVEVAEDLGGGLIVTRADSGCVQQIAVDINGAPYVQNASSSTNRPLYDASSTNVGIQFTESATNAADATKQGDQALYDAATKIGAQAHADAVTISNLLKWQGQNGTNSTQLTNVYDGGNAANFRLMTNLLGQINQKLATNGIGTGTNYINDSNIIAAINSEHLDSTNWTKFLRTNGVESLTSGVPASVSEAMERGHSTFDSVGASVDGVASGIGTMEDIGSGGDAIFDIEAGDYTFHIDLLGDSHFSFIWPVIRKVWKWLFAVAYLAKIVKELVAFSKNPQQAVTGKILNISFLGTNILGPAATFAATVIFMGIWAIALAAGFTALTASSGIGVTDLYSLATHSPLSGIPAVALNLFLATFPFAFVCALVSAYLVWRLTLLKTALVANAAARWCFGA